MCIVTLQVSTQCALSFGKISESMVVSYRYLHNIGENHANIKKLSVPIHRDICKMPSFVMSKISYRYWHDFLPISCGYLYEIRRFTDILPTFYRYR